MQNLKVVKINSDSIEFDNGVKLYSEHDQDMLDGAARIFNCARPKQYFFESEKEMLDSLKNVKYGDDNFEGYVIVDDKFNRLKVKSNTYIIFSQFNGDLESKWRLVDVVLTNEIEEVSSTFPAPALVRPNILLVALTFWILS